MINTARFKSGPVRTVCLLALAASTLAPLAHADQVEMQNGDRYLGKVLSMTADTVVLQSEVMGQLKLPRAKVNSIHLGAVAPAVNASKSKSPQASLAGTNLNSAALTLSNQSRTNAGQLSTQNAAQLLDNASPEAKAKFNEMVSGLLSGKLSEKDIRAEAKNVADQVRAMRGDLGEEAGGMLDAYLAILDRFVAEGPEKSTAPAKTQ